MDKSAKGTAASARTWAWMAGATLLCTAAWAQTDVKFSLSGAAEVPPVATSAKGSGEFSVASDHTLSGKFAVSGIAATAAHIHEGAIGNDGPVVIKLEKVNDGSFAVPPGTKLTDAQYKALSEGRLYVNVHSAAHPMGELRAQLSASGAATAAMPASGPSGY
jgi:hypothetical protein